MEVYLIWRRLRSFTAPTVLMGICESRRDAEIRLKFFEHANRQLGDQIEYQIDGPRTVWRAM